MKRLRTTFEIIIDEEKIAQNNISMQDILISMAKNEEIIANGIAAAMSFTNDIGLSNFSSDPVSIVVREIVSGKRMNDGIDDIRDRVREELENNGVSCYGMTDDEVEDICSTVNDVLEELSEEEALRFVCGEVNLIQDMADAEIAVAIRELVPGEYVFSVEP